MRVPSLIVSRIVTRGSSTSISKPNLMAHVKTVFYAIAPKKSHVHVHMENKQRCDEAQKRPSHRIHQGLDRCGFLLDPSK